jgi:hypothetical protein
MLTPIVQSLEASDTEHWTMFGAWHQLSQHTKTMGCATMAGINNTLHKIIRLQFNMAAAAAINPNL